MSIGTFVRAGCVATLLTAAAAVQAAPVTYTLDAANSGLGVTGSIDGQNISGQIGYLGGTSNKQEADRTNNTIKFLGGSSAIVPNRSGRYAPGAGPDPD